MTTRRRLHFEVIRTAQTCSDSANVFSRGAFIDGAFVPIKSTLVTPRRDALYEQTRKESDSKPRSRD